MKHYLWAIIWAILVLILISSPMPDVTDSRHSFPGIDKLVHTGFFFVFTVLMFFGSLMDGNEPNLISWPNVTDRKSTRLNSSHVKISYAVFCLKKNIKHSKVQSL